MILLLSLLTMTDDVLAISNGNIIHYYYYWKVLLL